MADKKELKEIKATTLVSMILHGANPFGLQLAKTIAGQGSKVIVLDEYSKRTKEYVQALKKERSIDFVAFEGMQGLYETLERFDYLFYLQFASFSEVRDYTSKEFLEESDRVSKTLEVAVKHKAKVSIVTSLHKNKKFIELTQLADSKPQPYSDIEIQRYTETITAEHYDKSNLNVRIVRLGALIGDGFTGYDDPEIEKLIQDSVEKDRLTISGEGLDNHHVIHYEDAIFGILKLTFNHNTNGEVVTLANPKPLTTLSVAYKLLELSPEATHIEFSKDDDGLLYKGHYALAPNAEKYEWKAKYQIEESFLGSLIYQYKIDKKKWKSDKAQILKEDTKGKPIVQTVKTPFGRAVDKILSPFTSFKSKTQSSTSTVGSFFSLKGIIIFTISLAVFLLLSYFIFTPLFNIGYGGYFATKEAKKAYEQVQNFELSQASEHFESSNEYLEQVNTGVVRLKWLADITGQGELHENFMNMLSAADYATSGAGEMSYALEPLAEYFKDFQPALNFDTDTPSTTKEYYDYLNQMRERRFLLVKASESLQYATLLISKVDPKVFPPQFQADINRLKTENQKVSDVIRPFEQTIYFLPEILGVDERQRYLILLQNPSEIRSTGGWLSSYALIGIEGGQVRQLDVDDIYNIDGALKVQGKNYEAPDSMQNALGIENWSMSLSNWDPDFPEAGRDAQFFLKEAGIAYDIDGVIGVDTNLIELFLEYWGEILLPDGTIVTKDNFNEKLVEIHNDFVPGSDRKSQFIADLANEVIKKIIGEKDSYKDYAEILETGLNRKNLLINLYNSSANRFFSQQDWDGALDKKYKSGPVPIEWNWGANKANMYIESTAKVRIDIESQDRIEFDYTLSHKNISTSNTYPEGDYENWFRLYMPENAGLMDYSGFSGDIQEYVDLGFKVVGGWFNTPAGGTNQLYVKYDALRNDDGGFPILVKDGRAIYNLSLFKQPGLYPGKTTLEIIYPDSWELVDSGDLNQGVNTLTIQLDQLEDINEQLIWEIK